MTESDWPIAAALARGPLHGTRVLDVSRILAGPHCAMILGDLGADVVKVEPPEGDETRRWGPPFFHGTAAYYFVANRNKRSVALDLKSPAGRNDLERLIRRADVLVHNFTAEVAAHLRLGVEEIRRENASCICVEITGFGPTQPNRRGYDLIAQALGGLMAVTGEPDGPPLKVGLPIADLTAGTYAATAVLAALLDRRVTGHGALIQVALIDAVTSILANQSMNWLLCGENPTRIGNDHPNVAPYGVYKTETQPIVVAATTDGQFQRLCRALGLENASANGHFARNTDRVAHRAELGGILESALVRQPAEHWVRLLASIDIPCSLIRTVAEALSSSDAHNIRAIDHSEEGSIAQVVGPIQMDGSYLDPRLPPPALDEHHRALLP